MGVIMALLSFWDSMPVIAGAAQGLRRDAKGNMMPKTRLDAFTDGVMAIIITIMVLELKVPEGETLGALFSL
jgi:hypothetical protein